MPKNNKNNEIQDTPLVGDKIADIDAPDDRGEVIHAYEQLFNAGKPIDPQLLQEITDELDADAAEQAIAEGATEYAEAAKVAGGDELAVHDEQHVERATDKRNTFVHKVADPTAKLKVNKFDLVFIKIWSVIVSMVIGMANGINAASQFMFKKKAPDKYVRAFVATVLIILLVLLVTLPFKVQVNSEDVYSVFGESMIPVKQRVYPDDEAGYPVYKWGYANKKSEIKIEPIYEEALPFMHGAAWVRVVKKETIDGNVNNHDYWKLIDKKGKDKGKVPQKFHYSSELGDGKQRPVGNFTPTVKLAWVFSGSYGYIDYKGNMKIEPKYKYAEDFSEGLARVREGSVELFIDKNGKQVGASYEEVKTFGNGRGAVRRNDLWGFIDAKGKLVIEPDYDNVSVFLGNYAAVKRKTNYGIIDNKGKIIVSPNDFKDWVALSPEFKALIDSIRE